MSETADAVEKKTRASAANFLPIVRGRLPLIFVHAIRFDEALSAMGNKDLATKFGTSVGKVFDIKKGRNFSYVDSAFKPSADDVAAAEGWIAQIGAENAKGLHAQGDRVLMQQVVDQYRERGLATAEEIAAFSAARAVARTRSEKASKTEAGQGATAAGTVDDLLG